MDDTIYQASDLAGNKRVDFLRDAKNGRARLRDKDGTSLVMLPEARLAVLEGHAYWSRAHDRLGGLLRGGKRPSIHELGDLAWLRSLDVDDLHLFVDELHEALIAGLADEDATAIDETVAAWRITARQLSDPLRRSVLLGVASVDEFDEVEPPAST